MDLNSMLNGSPPDTPPAAQEKLHPLAPFDQGMVRVYIRLLLCFHFPYESLRKPAEQQIRTALQATLTKWPFLAGRLGPQPRSTDASSTAATASSSTASPASHVPTPSSSTSPFNNYEYKYLPLLDRQYQSLRNPRQEPLTAATNFTLTTAPPPPPSTGLLELKYPHPTPPVTSAAPDGFNVFRARTLTADDGWELSYKDCCVQRMRPGILKKELLSSLPEHPVEEGKSYPALGVQANWIDGGLILCFAFHHSVMDGAGIRTFLETFAGHMRDLRYGRVVSEEAPDGDEGVREGLEMAGRGKGVPEEFDFGNRVSTPMPTPAIPGDVSKILRFPVKGLKQVKRMVMEELEVMRQPGSGDDAGAVTYVSTTDCVCALMWVAIMRTRYSRGRSNQSMNEFHKLLKAEEATRFNIAVNARRRLNPSLDDEYIGNAFVVAVAKANVGEIVGFPRPGIATTATPPAAPHTQGPSPAASQAHPGSDPTPPPTPTTASYAPPSAPKSPPPTPTGPPHPLPGGNILPPLTIRTITLAATRIRAAILAVDDRYIRHRLAFADTLGRPSSDDPGTGSSTRPPSPPPPDKTPADAHAALHRALDPARTGVDFSSWVDFGAELDFGIPGTRADGGRPQWVRKTWSANPGAVNILPRAGGTGAPECPRAESPGDAEMADAEEVEAEMEEEEAGAAGREVEMSSTGSTNSAGETVEVAEGGEVDDGPDLEVLVALAREEVAWLIGNMVALEGWTGAWAASD